MLTLVVLLQTQQRYDKKENNKPFYSVKTIFQEHWNDYKITHNPRQVEIEEVEKMLSCKQKCFVCYCKRCNSYEFVNLGCNSRICSCCGKRYTDQWADRLANRVKKGIVHRHIVCTLPVELREIIKKNRHLQKVISDASFRAIRKTFSSMKKKQI